MEVLKATGPGKVVTPGAAPTGGVRAALTNFDIDGDRLETEHNAFLDAQVVPVLRRSDSICILRGEASHNDFSTTSAIATTDFGGAARFTSSGAGPFSVNFLNFMGLPAGVATVPNPLKIDTGFTVGLGMSTSVGNMILGFTGPFTGP